MFNRKKGYVLGKKLEETRLNANIFKKYPVKILKPFQYYYLIELQSTVLFLFNIYKKTNDIRQPTYHNNKLHHNIMINCFQQLQKVVNLSYVIYQV